jgi:hypothetical protein
VEIVGYLIPTRGIARPLIKYDHKRLTRSDMNLLYKPNFSVADELNYVVMVQEYFPKKDAVNCTLNT